MTCKAVWESLIELQRSSALCGHRFEYSSPLLTGHREDGMKLGAQHIFLCSLYILRLIVIYIFIYAITRYYIQMRINSGIYRVAYDLLHTIEQY